MSNKSPIRVFSVDDHPLLREGIAALVNNQPDMVLARGSIDGRGSDSNIQATSARRNVAGPAACRT